ncbi:conserved hypothetical protein (plasmid) [Arthrobacter sp. Hiyo8]|nr:conserved hypothetical protein [Arthrobacter sp. Hiyo8]
MASFIFADLIVLPIILIYRKYYGTKAALRITGTFYLAMVLAGYAVEVIFAATGLTPHTRNAIVAEAGISWNYTTWLNIAFHALALLLVTRFLLNGGARMLKMMGGSPDTHEHAGHNAHEHAVSDHGHEHGARTTATSTEAPPVSQPTIKRIPERKAQRYDAQRLKLRRRHANCRADRGPDPHRWRRLPRHRYLHRQTVSEHRPEVVGPSPTCPHCRRCDGLAGRA